ncbi:MAG: glycosyltransferase family 2 protein [Chitinophagaceae bacterium]|nr:glycosyltransferase family 2 protein [Chitinophagaceae bacterium]
MMQQTYPLVSVLMTAYNREKYIAEAIESVLASDYENFELIIVDDCSNDETVTIAKKYALKDSRVQVHINEVNLGDYPNRNRAAGYAKGIYLMYCDSDDTLYPDGVSRCVQLMQEHRGISFAMYRPNDKGTPLVLSSADALHQHFLTKPFLTVGPGGTIISRSFFEKIKGFPEKYGPASDMYYNLKCASLSPILLIPFEFLNYRIHAGQEINNRDSYLHNSYLF